MTALEKFAAFGTQPPSEIDSLNVRRHTKRAILDWYAAAIPGSVEPPATLLREALDEDFGNRDARLIDGSRTTARTAALINGTAAHTVEVDDIFKHGIFHPGAPTIAAALAVAQQEKADGARLLRAVAVGYEISTRIAAALGRSHYKYWHNTGTAGAFGAAAAAASLYGLEAKQFAHALATTATFASGLQQAFRMDSMSKPLHAGRAAEGGVMAAQMARAGVTGGLDVLDGAVGMGVAMSDGADWPAVLSDIGREYNITQMTFKNHACCGHTFAPIDGTKVLVDQFEVRPEQIHRITISTYAPALAVAGNLNPTTAAEARFSIPFVVATAVIHGKVRLAAFAKERLESQALREFMRKIELRVDPELDAQFPAQRAARVEFQLDGGRTVEFLQPCRKGDPESPLSDEELQAKFDELAQPVIGEWAANSLARRIWALEAESLVP